MTCEDFIERVWDCVLSGEAQKRLCGDCEAVRTYGDGWIEPKTEACRADFNPCDSGCLKYETVIRIDAALAKAWDYIA